MACACCARFIIGVSYWGVRTRHTPSEPWESYVGRAIASARRAQGITQEGLAEEARDHFGLAWTRSTVASIETKQRGISLIEAAAICHVLPRQFPNGVADLFPETPAAQLHVSSIGEVTAHRVRASLSGNPAQNLEETRADAKSEKDEDVRDLVTEIGRLLDTPPIRIPLLVTEAERKAAASLRVPVEQIREAAQFLWNCPLTQERDRRLGVTPMMTSPSLAVRRGHVTRQLLAEITEALIQTEGTP